MLVVLGRFTLGLGHLEKSEVKRKGHVQQLQQCHQVTYHSVTAATVSLAVASGIRGAEMMEVIHAMNPARSSRAHYWVKKKCPNHLVLRNFQGDVH